MTSSNNRDNNIYLNLKALLAEDDALRNNSYKASESTITLNYGFNIEFKPHNQGITFALAYVFPQAAEQLIIQFNENPLFYIGFNKTYFCIILHSKNRRK